MTRLKSRPCGKKEAYAGPSLFLRPLPFGLLWCSPTRVMSVLHGLLSKSLHQSDPQIINRAFHALLVLLYTAWQLAMQFCCCKHYAT